MNAIGTNPVRLGNRTYRTWKDAKLTLMVRLGNRTYRTWKDAKLTLMVRLGNRTYRPWQGWTYRNRTYLFTDIIVHIT